MSTVQAKYQNHGERGAEWKFQSQACDPWYFCYEFVVASLLLFEWIMLHSCERKKVIVQIVTKVWLLIRQQRACSQIRQWKIAKSEYRIEIWFIEYFTNDIWECRPRWRCQGDKPSESKQEPWGHLTWICPILVTPYINSSNFQGHQGSSLAPEPVAKRSAYERHFSF